MRNSTRAIFGATFCKTHAAWAAVLIAGMAFALCRMKGLDHISNSLWAEDGKVFLNDTLTIGAESIWRRSSGYLHVLLRLHAMASTFLDFKFAPYLYFVGWLIICLLLIFVVAYRTMSKNGNPWLVAVLLALIFLQPNSGEVFYTLTNAQWILGCALAVWLCTLDGDPPRKLELLLVFLASLTGPFALLLTPIILIRIFVFKDWRLRKGLYVTIFTAVAIQAYTITIFSIERPSTNAFDSDISHWIKSFAVFFSFGEFPRSPPFAFLSVLFWAALLHSLYRRSELTKEQISSALLLMAAAAILFGAGLLRQREDPFRIHPLQEGARYYFIPYALIFVAGWLLTANRTRLRIFMLAIAGTISIHSFSRIDRTDLQWRAYAAFANVIPGISIPIHPQNPVYPSSSVTIPDNGTTGETSIHSTVAPEAQRAANATYRPGKDSRLFVPVSEDPQLYFDASKQCDGYKYIGLDIDIDRPESGWAQLFWRKNAEFTEHDSIRRFYDAGRLKMRFATKNKDIKELRFDPLNSMAAVHIYSITMYCIGVH